MDLDFSQCKTKEDVEKVFNKNKEHFENLKTAKEHIIEMNKVLND